MRTLVVVFLLLLISLPGEGQVPADSLQAFRQRSPLRQAIVGVSVKRLSDGETICDWQAEQSMAPASLLKLISTFLALEERGGDFRYETTVGYSGVLLPSGDLRGDLVVVPGGDPSLESAFFADRPFLSRVVQVVQAAGIRRICGAVKVLPARSDMTAPGGWLWEDLGNYYGATYQTFNYRDNSYRLTFQSGKSGAVARLVAVEPPLPGVEFDNRVITDRRGKNDVWIYGAPGSGRLLVRGTVTGTPARYAARGAMPDPARVFEAEMTALLEQEGVVVDEEKYTEKKMTVLYRHLSPELKELVYYANKRSVNLLAEAAGRLVAPADSWEEAVAEKLGALGISTSGIRLADACGLSPLNAIPPVVLTDLLIRAASSPDFLASLPQGGVDPGLAVYAQHPLLNRQLQAKTGSFTGVRGLAGYLTTRQGTTLAFTVMVNHFTCTPVQAQEAIRHFLVWLAERE